MHYFSEAWFTGSENYKSSNSVDDPNYEPDKAVITAQKMKFSITEKSLNWKFHFLCSEWKNIIRMQWKLVKKTFFSRRWTEKYSQIAGFHGRKRCGDNKKEIWNSTLCLLTGNADIKIMKKYIADYSWSWHK